MCVARFARAGIGAARAEGEVMDSMGAEGWEGEVQLQIDCARSGSRAAMGDHARSAMSADDRPRSARPADDRPRWAQPAAWNEPTEHEEGTAEAVESRPLVELIQGLGPKEIDRELRLADRQT